MTFPPIYSVLLGLVPCLIPPYALKLNRVFGTKRVGWVLFAVFALLGVLQVMRALQPMGLGLDPGVTLDLLNFLVPVLLLVSMVHIETLFRERLRIEQQEQQMRASLEIQVQERTADLNLANEELQREISLRKQGEEELRKSKENYRFLFDENPQPMWIYDQSTFQFLAFNAAALRFYGFSRAEFRDMTAKELCSSSEAEAFVADAGKTPAGSDHRRVWSHRKKDGSIVEVELISLDLTYSGRPARLVLANDVSAQRQLQKQLLLSQKVQLTTQLASGVVDKFSGFIGTIESEAGFLAQGAQHPAVRERLNRVVASAACASSLTRQLLALIGRHPMHPQMLDLNRIVENELQSFTSQLGDKIVLEKAYWENLPPIAGDKTLVQQVVNNLLANAIEAMPQGGLLTLSTAAVRVDEDKARSHEGAYAGTFACFGISDTGCGMSAEVQSHLFEPFFTTKQVPGAAGLGLSSVLGLVKQHGGWIDVKSKPGDGTRITVFFPCGTASTPAKRRAMPSRQSVPSAASN